MTLRKILAWGVHLYTASGLIAAAIILVLLVQGGDEAIRQAFIWMFVATVIDTTDGWLARKANVKKFASTFDGRRLDDLIDFNTYTTLPLMLIWRANLLQEGSQWWLLLPLLASAYGFCQTQAKTADNFFLGFPSYWNIVAFYLYLAQPPHIVSLVGIIILALLTFVPSLYLYTTHGGRFSLFTNLFGIAWAISLIALFMLWHRSPQWLLWASFSFPVYYFLASWIITINYWTNKKSDSK
ncbi:MAG: CDP-alcohol phosphatidyltransferase family protein [Acidobacteria bacterium]|nr:CDP-alcohol phosphatidyltransferase family protein [Acidobacteriota bacterium]